MYAPTPSYINEGFTKFCEDVQSVMNTGLAHYNEIMGNFNAKIGKKVGGENMSGNHVVDSRNDLVDFAKNHSLTIMTTFFYKKAHQKWITLKSNK